jgi:hypothetical protein
MVRVAGLQRGSHACLKSRAVRVHHSSMTDVADVPERDTSIIDMA